MSCQYDCLFIIVSNCPVVTLFGKSQKCRILPKKGWNRKIFRSFLYKFGNYRLMKWSQWIKEGSLLGVESLEHFSDLWVQRRSVADGWRLPMQKIFFLSSIVSDKFCHFFSKKNYALICFRFSFCKVSDFFRFINGKGGVDKTLVTVSE